MTGTEVRLSASGRRASELKRTIGESLKRLGFTAHRHHIYKHQADVEAPTAAKIIDMAYAIDNRLDDCTLMSFVIIGRLANVTLRRNANRAI